MLALGNHAKAVLPEPLAKADFFVSPFVSVASLFSCQLRRKGVVNVDSDPPAPARRHAEKTPEDVNVR